MEFTDTPEHTTSSGTSDTHAEYRRHGLPHPIPTTAVQGSGREDLKETSIVRYMYKTKNFSISLAS